MSRKEFNAIAAAIKSEVEKYDSNFTDALDAVRETAEAIANVCADSNNNFDRRRFLTACGFIF